jgi:acetyl-CoA carboxylase biotin carboxyl carrier protein
MHCPTRLPDYRPGCNRKSTRKQKIDGVLVPNLTPHDIDSIVELFKSGDWNELELRYGESELFLSKRAGDRPSWGAEEPAPQQTSAPRAAVDRSPANPTSKALSAPMAPPTAVPIPEGHVIVAAPSLGSFYRAAKPGVPPFVEIGAQVTPDTELCLIEVMKLFTTLRAGVRGMVTQILVADGAMIERGQSLFVIDANE